ncbi:Hint domain-containing protein [Ruegeria atlantica]|uniref:Hint domain-containing protein n=1 Tax=Ruegeria atlantica TaxID=81569 RepID=UPI002493F3DE|nr:Hint domain-containing protein [Ruegeria atlantica]
MANYSYIGYDPDVISVITAGPDRVILDTDFDPSTDRRVFNVEDAAGGNILPRPGDPTLPDAGTVFNGDYNSDENGDDLTQTGTVTNLDGSTTFLSGDIYLEESYILTDPDGGTITVYRVEVEGDLAGYITSEPLEVGTEYSMTIVNVTPGNAPDTANPTSIVDVPCFTAGTLIRTPGGDMAIERLSAGDLVKTMDHGPQRIRWIGARKLSSQELSEKPKLRPIHIAAGALGNGLPQRNLLVSPQHRMLVRSAIAIRMFETSEILVAAHALVGVPGISVEENVQSVEYYHMLFERHEIVFAEGAPSESLFAGAEALRTVPPAARAEILELFPALATEDFVPPPARPIPSKGKQVRNMVQRHIKNSRSLIE